ncbi:hypothetical protein ERJ75_000605000 [Trypanosoma vivax]|nr:hypothetical protein ERJ75_000605000 [Trypanosoma vivax]
MAPEHSADAAAPLGQHFDSHACKRMRTASAPSLAAPSKMHGNGFVWQRRTAKSAQSPANKRHQQARARETPHGPQLMFKAFQRRSALGQHATQRDTRAHKHGFSRTARCRARDKRSLPQQN